MHVCGFGRLVDVQQACLKARIKTCCVKIWRLLKLHQPAFHKVPAACHLCVRQLLPCMQTSIDACKHQKPNARLETCLAGTVDGAHQSPWQKFQTQVSAGKSCDMQPEICRRLDDTTCKTNNHPSSPQQTEKRPLLDHLHSAALPVMHDRKNSAQ